MVGLGTLTLRGKQRKEFYVMMTMLSTIYSDARKEFLNRHARDLTQVDYYINHIMKDIKDLPRELVSNTVQRAWGHAQTSDRVYPTTGFKLILERKNYWVRSNIFQFVILEHLPILTEHRIKCSVPYVKHSKEHWLVIELFEYGCVFGKEPKVKIPRYDGKKMWSGGKLLIQNNLRGAFKVWARLHNDFLKSYLKFYPNLDNNFNQLMGFYNVWEDKLSTDDRNLFNAFPTEVKKYLLFKIMQSIGNNEKPRKLKKETDYIYLLCGTPEILQYGSTVFSPLHNKSVKYKIDKEQKAPVLGTVNREHIMKVSSIPNDDTYLHFHIKPTESLDGSNFCTTSYS